ncbi:uncharacterized protein LOC143895304 isoform X2 [Temnothorax americanus]|uniref:uncharacterized protein LOC143895304 isoform X2 n=1 Tax=Temnothorax americanus TaxID=1964332 RepID=UPI00406989D4
MSNRHETTFGDLQVDERFKKLQRSLKLAVLRQESSRSSHDGKMSAVTAWPSISSINVDTLDSSCAVSSPQISFIRSEVLASSNNLRNILLRKNTRNTKQEAMITSSVKQYRVQQDDHVDRLVMPPPAKNTIYRAFREPSGTKVRTLSNCEQTASTSLDRSAQSSTAHTAFLKSAPSRMFTNTNADKEYLNTVVAPATPTNCFEKVDRVFMKWKVMLNDQYELIIKGTLKCGRIARSKSVIRRYSATCVESKFKHKYILQGNIVDERKGLPDYIRGKFYNGFPDDWENVYQIWRTYVSQGCSVMFRWPTPVTDSDDDLKSELTDLTYTCARNDKAISATGSCNINKYPKTKNLNNTPEKQENCRNYSTHSSRNHEKNTSFVKPFISNSEKEDVIPVMQIKNIKPLCDEDDKQNVKTDINQSFSSRKIKLKDILQEDKLNIIINNLADRNCSPKYIDKIIEMFGCLDYVVSYKMGSECNNDSLLSASHETCNPKTVQSLVYDDSHANSNKLENKQTELKNCWYSTDLGYGSIRNDFNAVQLSNPVNIKPKHDKDSDKSESETYTGVPKVSIERVLKARESPRKIHKRKVRKKTIYPDAQKYASNLPCDVENVKFESVHVPNQFANTKKNLLFDDSCFSVTEDEVETTSDTRECRKIVNVTQRPQEMTFSSHREIQRNNFNVYGGGKSVTHVQNEQPSDAFEAQKVNLNAFIKEQQIAYRNVQERTHSHFVADVDYTTNSYIDVATVSMNARKTGGNTMASHAEMDQDIAIISESKKPCASPKLHKEFIEQTKSEFPKKRFKPTIISSMPVNLKISKVDSKSGQHESKIIIKHEAKQNANIRPLEETDKTSMLKTSINTKPAIDVSDVDFLNNSHSKTTVDTVDDKREICPIINNKNELDNNINPTNSTTNPTNEQPKSSKLGVEENPKMLTAWTPKVVYYGKSKSELGLTFQGKLLNEAGHVVHRKFTTDIVARRLSVTLIETVNHEFYELLGHLNDNKHTIPKELSRQCRYGCPAKIEQFCLTWETLQHNNVQKVEKKLHDTTMDCLNAPISSRGRRILPPLCYWIGERVTLKDNNPIYSPGNSQESSLLSLTDNSKEIQKNTTNTEEKKKRKVNSKNTSKEQDVNKQTSLPESNKTSGTNKNQAGASKKSPKIKTANDVRKSDNSKKSRKSVNSKRRRRLAQKLMFSSSDSSDSSEEERKVSPMTLRKRPKIEASSNRILCRDTTKSKHYTAYYSPTKRHENREMTCTYHQNVPQEDFLSEDEVSYV